MIGATPFLPHHVDALSTFATPPSPLKGGRGGGAVDSWKSATLATPCHTLFDQGGASLYRMLVFTANGDTNIN